MCDLSFYENSDDKKPRKYTLLQQLAANTDLTDHALFDVEKTAETLSRTLLYEVSLQIIKIRVLFSPMLTPSRYRTPIHTTQWITHIVGSPHQEMIQPYSTLAPKNC
jgi:hypothetical protein